MSKDLEAIRDAASVAVDRLREEWLDECQADSHGQVSMAYVELAAALGVYEFGPDFRSGQRVVSRYDSIHRVESVVMSSKPDPQVRLLCGRTFSASEFRPYDAKSHGNMSGCVPCEHAHLQEGGSR